jgi:hypothetical protein
MTLSFVEMDSQHVELLPARTVMSLFNLSGTTTGAGGDGGGGKGGPVACAVSIGNLSLGLGALLSGGAADGQGSSCNSTGSGGSGGGGVTTK